MNFGENTIRKMLDVYLENIRFVRTLLVYTKSTRKVLSFPEESWKSTLEKIVIQERCHVLWLGTLVLSLVNEFINVSTSQNPLQLSLLSANFISFLEV